MRVKGAQRNERNAMTAGKGVEETLGKHDGVSGGRARGASPRRG